MSYGAGYGGQYTGGRGDPPQYEYSANYGHQQGYGGGAPRPPQGPPPGADPRLWEWFHSVDTDSSGAITARELQQALVNGDWSPFDFDTVQLLMNIFDSDRSGTIGFTEFSGLWKYIQDWKNVFHHFDSDRSGVIDGNELANALKQFGYNLPPHLLSLVLRKYDGKAGAPSARGTNNQSGVTFDRFVRVCVVVKTLTESFQRLDTDKDGWIQINYDTFMHTVLSAP